MGSLQENLVGAVGDVVTLTEQGDDPLKAMVKVASTRSLLPAQIDRLCQLHNKATLLSQKLAGSTLDDRIEVMARIVDPRQVREQLSQRLVKQAAAPLPATARMLEVSRRQLFEVSAEEPSQTKTAEFAVPVVKRDPSHGLHHGVAGLELYDLRKTIRAKIAALEDDAERLAVQSEVAVQLGTKAVCKIASGPTGPEAISQLEYSLGQACPGAVVILNDAISPSSAYFGQKRAEFKVEPPQAWLPNVVGAGSATDYCVRGYNAVREFTSQLPKLCAKIAALREELHLLDTRTVNGQVVNREFVLGNDTLCDRQMAHFAKVADLVQSYLGATLAGAGGAKPPSARALTPVERFQLKLQNPQHEAQLGAVKTRAALQTLMVDDPVIAATPEEQVVAAFNELSAYSPQITQNPAAFRAVLRQYLQNNSSSFDLASIKNLERSGRPK